MNKGSNSRDRSRSNSDSSIEEIELGRSIKRLPESPSLSSPKPDPSVRVRKIASELRSESSKFRNSNSSSPDNPEREKERKFTGLKKIPSTTSGESPYIRVSSSAVDDTLRYKRSESARERRTERDISRRSNSNKESGDHKQNMPLPSPSDSSNQLITQSQSVSRNQTPAWAEKSPSPPRTPIQSSENYSLIESAESRSPTSTDGLHPVPSQTVQKPSSCMEWIKTSIRAIYDSILFPMDFLVFNVICILQTVPALTYYIYFFQRNYSLPASSGMPPVWGSTIGAISSAIVGSALTPVPAAVITRSVCTAIVIWEFVICISTAAAAVGLGLQRRPDIHGVVWSGVCCLSTLTCGLYLRWVGITIISMSRNMKTATLSEGDRTRSADSADLSMPAIFNNGSSSTDAIDSELLNKQSTERVESKSTTSPSCLSCVLVRLAQGLLWVVIIVFYLIPIGFGANSLLQMIESRQYPPPGQTFQVLVRFFNATGSNRKDSNQQTFPMHIYCSGQRSGGRPTLVVEADANITGFAYRNLQILLSTYPLSTATLGWRVCLYDRAGFGWSAMSPLGSNRPMATAARLKSLLDQAGETTNNHQIILIGHGDGFALVQLFAHTYPSIVAGVAMLDGFPNLLRLQGRSNRDIFDATTASCGTLNMIRALESVGVSRALLAYYWSSYSKSFLGISDSGVSWMDGKTFAPSSDMGAFKSTFNNANYYAAIYNDYCMRKNTATQFTDRLSAVGTVQGQYTVKWPRLPQGVPLFMAVAGNTLAATGGSGTVYQVQLQQFNSSLVWNSSLVSPNGYPYSKTVVCQQCDHSFPLDSSHSRWLADEMDEFFSQFF